MAATFSKKKLKYQFWHTMISVKNEKKNKKKVEKLEKITTRLDV